MHNRLALRRVRGLLMRSERTRVRAALTPMLKVYTLANCDTCRRATKWLRAHGVAFEEIAIRVTPPPPAELRAALAAAGGKLRALCNTAGRDYREQKLGEKLPTLSETDAIALLAANGNLVKRPFVSGGGQALAGFDADAWSARWLQKRTTGGTRKGA